jgi:2'-5' RNA ligase
MRLFVAVELEDTAAAVLGRIGEACRRRAARIAPSARVTWVPADRLHLTVRFIGEVDEGRASSLQQALATPMAIAPFALTFTGLGAFPPQGPPRVLWIGIGAGREALLAAEGEVSARLERCGVPREGRPFSPHLTLARVRDAAGLAARDLFAAHDAPLAIDSGVNAITLFESRLSSSGPTYRARQRTPLIGPT